MSDAQAIHVNDSNLLKRYFLVYRYMLNILDKKRGHILQGAQFSSESDMLQCLLSPFRQQRLGGFFGASYLTDFIASCNKKDLETKKNNFKGK